VIGNPPFLGGKLLITYLGEDYVSRMFETYAGRVPAEADLVCYWFEKAGKQIASGKAKRAGLVATNSIRGGANRRALQAATTQHRSYEAWSDEPWVNDGAAVRVSLICFSAPHDESVGGARLDGESVDEIYTDLTARRGVRDPLAGGHDDGQEQTIAPHDGRAQVKTRHGLLPADVLLLEPLDRRVAGRRGASAAWTAPSRPAAFPRPNSRTAPPRQHRSGAPPGHRPPRRRLVPKRVRRR